MKNYQYDINKVLSYIDFHLHEKQDLDTLAKVAHLSKFHFHRIMKAYLNESLGSYINRLRLETAAKLLCYSDHSITDIAYKVGYDTPSAFNKGFKKIFNVSPKAFREDKMKTLKQKRPITIAQDFQLVKTTKHVEPIRVIFQRSKGRIGEIATQNNWQQLFDYVNQKQFITSATRFIGISWDDPAITKEQEVRYDACISIEEKYTNITECPTKIISGGRYLCFLYKGDYQNLDLVYMQIFKNWILNGGYNLREEPVFEQYLNNKAIYPKEELLTEIYVPIE